MLIINVTKPGDIVSLKLTSNDEVIGKLVSDENGTLVLNKPVVLAMAQSGPTMVPYMLTAEPTVHEFTFKEQHVVHCVPTAKSLASQYIQGTTGIVSAGNIQI
jgi:hypothetical protein